MITLILTEKPSVAKDFAVALGVGAKRDGYLEGNSYVITWAVGHLLQLAEPRDYDRKWAKWNMASLPILPESLKYNAISKVEKQLRVIQKQLSRNDLGQVVIATDAGREGEVIARTILQTVETLDYSKIYRFWTSQALTPQVVVDAMKNLKPGTEYERLWNAGQARQIADWLVGMNLSRAATLKLGRPKETYSVGRVQTAVLALLVDRKRERESFNPKPYRLLRACFTNPKGNWWGNWFKKTKDRFENQEQAEAVLAAIQGRTGEVKSVKKEKKKQAPPLLYSLTDLQREANSRYGLSAKQTLDTAQHLYEAKKCLSYPRTDSKVLGSQNVGMVKNIISKLSVPYPELFLGIEKGRVSTSNKRVFNDARLTDHHALIPLAPLPASAAQNERRIYDLVLKRFAAAFHPDHEYEATEIITEVCKETFRTKGNRPLVQGWKAVYGAKEADPDKNDNDIEEENLPPLEKDDPAIVEETRLEEKMTQPPPEYTEALLLKDMTNPSRFVTEEELQKVFKGDVGLGTQATRAQIIETLIDRIYVIREKKKLAATEKGCFLIDRLRQFKRARIIASPEETARWETELERIALGIGNPEAFLTAIRIFVKDGVEEFKMSDDQRIEQEPFGKCPACGGNVVEGKKGYGCGNWREQDGGCRFVIWKAIAGRTLDSDTIRALLSGETTSEMTFTSKEGKEFSAALKVEYREDEGKWLTRFVFSGQGSGAGSDGAGGQTVLGLCPRCGADVVEGKKGYGCRNWREEDGGCRFVIWKVIAGKQLPEEAVKDLLDKHETSVIRGFISKKGKEFSAGLRLEGDDFKTSFVFD
ncbi:MAG: DNA topoisomerase 3 [Syntrophobacteraceae bacterium]